MTTKINLNDDVINFLSVEKFAKHSSQVGTVNCCCLFTCKCCYILGRKLDGCLVFIHVTAYCKKLIFLKTKFKLWNLSCYQPNFAFRCHGILVSIFMVL